MQLLGKTNCGMNFSNIILLSFADNSLSADIIVDFYCSKAKIIVEADGGGHFNDDKIKYDKERDLFLQSKGYIVLHFTNLEIDKNFYEVCSVIDREVKKRI